MDGREAYARVFGIPAADGFGDFLRNGAAEVSPAWLKRLETTVEADSWIDGFAIVHNATNTVIGSASFKGPPDADGVVEVAYGVVPGEQGRGYATEATQALVAFAFDDARVRVVRAHTLPQNDASGRVLAKCGFTCIAQVVDPDDGPVWRWELGRPSHVTGELRVVSADHDDLDRYIDLLEELAEWLEGRGIRQWPRGRVRRTSGFFAESIARREVQLAFMGEELAGTLRLLMEDPIVWPECPAGEAVYIYNLGVRRAWAGLELGGRLLDWAQRRSAWLGRRFVRLDCRADNQFLSEYYERHGFTARGVVDARYPDPVGVERLLRYEKAVHA